LRIIDGRGKPLPSLPSGNGCRKQPDPEQLVVHRPEGNRYYPALPESAPSLAEADKRSRKADWFGELAFAIIDTSPALPDSVPNSGEFSPDSEDEVRAGIERKRIW